MIRSIFLFGVVFATTVVAGFVWIQRGKWLAAAQATAPQLKVVSHVLSPDPVKREDLVPKVEIPPARDLAPQIELPKILEEETPQKSEAPPPRLLLDRWPMPRGSKDPENTDGVSMFVDPSGPSVVTQNKAGAVARDAATGRTRMVPRREPTVSLKYSLVNGKAVCQIRDRKTKLLLLELKESPARTACITPDGERIIVVSRPSDYPRHYYVNPTKGVSVHEEEVFKNIRVFDIATGKQLGEFGPRNHGMDDNAWAIAAAPDGQSFYLLTQRNLYKISFEKAFGVPPLPPQGL